MSGKRPNKNKTAIGDTFIVLGSGSSANPAGSSATGSKAPLKREAVPVAAAATGSPAKKLKVASSSKKAEWTDVAIAIEPQDLFAGIVDAESAGDEERIEVLLCSAAKYLKTNRLKPDVLLSLSLIYLARTKPALFSSSHVHEAFLSLLKRDPVVSIKTKISNGSQILAANLLFAVLKFETNWPKGLIPAFAQDALNERLWVDSCSGLSDNIIASVGTKIPPQTATQAVMSAPTGSATTLNVAKAEPSSGTSSPTQSLLTGDESNSMDVDQQSVVQEEDEVPVLARFSEEQTYLMEYMKDVTNEYLNRKPMTSEKSLVRFLSAVVGIPSVRLLVAARIEGWMQNPKIGKAALELFWHLIWNSAGDSEVFAIILRSRIKAKSLVTHFMTCVKEFLAQNEDNLQLVLRQVVLNELSPARGVHNMAIVSVVFQFAPEKATKLLARMFQELLLKEDSLKNLRVLLREMVRSLRHDFLNMTLFVASLVEERSPFLDADVTDPFLRERIFSSVIDLITLCMFLSVSPSIKEAASYSKADRKDIMRSFQVQVSEMMRSGMYWLQKSYTKLFPERTEFIHATNKLLLMDPIESYVQKDNWPPESDRILILKLSSEVPLQEDTLMRLLNCGFSSHPISPTEAIELSDALIKRAASIYEGDSRSYPVLLMRNEDVFHLMLRSTTYRIPENISLPVGYAAPELAVSDWYWKVWIQLLILTAHNPLSFGRMAWTEYPTLSVLIEMAITNNCEFPPPTSAVDDIRAAEASILSQEKEKILEFESHLAAATSKIQITENNSLLLSKVISQDPRGVARRPPNHVLEQIKVLNVTFKLGHLLCQSRSPDFLLDIIQRQQKLKSQRDNFSGLAPVSMPWLNQLVVLHEDNYSALPVQCLCEFLMGQIHDEEVACARGTGVPAGDGTMLSSLVSGIGTIKSVGAGQHQKQSAASAAAADKSREKEKKRQFRKLVSYFSLVINSDEYLAKELIDYFMKRLGFQQQVFRSLAAKALHLILLTEEEREAIEKKGCENNSHHLSSSFAGEDESDDMSFAFIQKLKTIACFPSVRETVCQCLQWACATETSPTAIHAYVQFLTESATFDSGKVALSLAHLLIDRAAVTCALTQSRRYKDSFCRAMGHVFLKYVWSVRRVRTSDEPEYSWSDSQDRVLVRWQSGESAVLPISVVHAMMVLLTFEPLSRLPDLQKDLIDMWFSPPPKSYLVDTSEEALLLPDWLKLRLLRSSNSVLVDAALMDLDSSQLVLFIQSFGLPPASMQRLLQALDECCVEEEDVIRSSIPDEGFMRHLIEVQWMRGVKAGQRFAAMIGVQDAALAEAAPQSNASSCSPFEKKTDAKVRVGEEKQQNSTFAEWLHDPTKDPNFLSSFSKTIGKELFASKRIPLIASGSKSQKPAISQCESLVLEMCALLTPPPASGSSSRSGKQRQEQLQQQHVRRESLTRLIKDNSLNSLIVMLASKSAQESAKSGSSALHSAVCQLQTILSASPDLKGTAVCAALQSILKHGSKVDSLISSRKPAAKNDSPKRGRRAAATTSSPAGEGEATTTSSNNVQIKSESAQDLLSMQVQQSVCNSRQFRRYLQSEDDLLIDQEVIFKGELDSKQYLLPLILHKSNFETIRIIVNKVLSSDQPADGNYNATTVLDLLTAALDCPRLWKGRDLKKPTHFVCEDVLKLDGKQVEQLVDFVLREGNPEKRAVLMLRSCFFSDSHVHIVEQKLSGHSSRQGQVTINPHRRRFLPEDLLSRLPVTSGDLNACTHLLTDFFRSLSPIPAFSSPAS